ncbi:MAG: exopolyphosphatase [Planctomycetaceae bacterium]|nr:exopolyphosphatase [Planctomycetaceae bacterium]
MDPQTRSTSTRSRIVAVIDIGTSAIRMAIAEILPDGAIRHLESLTQALSLGHQSFTAGEISRGMIEECIAVLRAYRRKLEEYGITRSEDIRIVATSAVREAVNRINFVDRVFVATGLSVETLDAAEIHRITYRGVQPLLKAQPALFKSRSMIVEVGGGSTELLILEEGNVDYSHAFRLGSLRLQQTLASYHVPRSRAKKLLEAEIHSHLEPFEEMLTAHPSENMVAMGSDMRFACEEILDDPVKKDRLVKLKLDRLAEFVDFLFSQSEESIVNRFHLTYAEAETVGPALLANLKIAEAIHVDRIYVCSVNLRDGLVRDLSEGGAWSEDFRKQILRATWELARKYDVDEDHAKTVAELCRLLFQQLRKYHELEERYETVLCVAAALHEIGAYINTSSMHKHSMYLIMNSSLFGLTQEDLNLIGMVARYHRRAMPKSSHQAYASMDRQRRVVVSKLAAILRIAIALDASRNQRIRQLECSQVRDRIILTVPQTEDLSMEQIAVRRNRTFFEAIFGLDILLRTQSRPLVSEPSSQL